MSKFRVEIQLAFIVEAESEDDVESAVEEEMMGVGMAHLEAMHPEMAESVKTMSKDDPMMVAWVGKFNSDWESTPEDA